MPRLSPCKQERRTTGTNRYRLDQNRLKKASSPARAHTTPCFGQTDLESDCMHVPRVNTRGYVLDVEVAAPKQPSYYLRATLLDSSVVLKRLCETNAYRELQISVS